MKDRSLSTERLLIRSPRPDDLDARAALLADAEVMRYIGDGEPRNREQSAEGLIRSIQQFEEFGGGLWSVVLPDSEEIIGDCGLVPIQHSREAGGKRGPEIEIGYRFARAHWGKGYATEAAAAILSYGEQQLGLRLILAVTYPENLASQNVLRKIGFRELGLTRAYYDQETLAFEKRNRPST